YPKSVTAVTKPPDGCCEQELWDASRHARRQSVAGPNGVREWPKQVGDAIRIVTHQLTLSGKDRVAVARLHEASAHRQHSPRTSERRFDAPIVTNHPGVQLQQRLSHLRHSL